MKKCLQTIKLIIYISLMIVMLFSMCGCERKEKEDTYEIALVTDIGQLMDSGFNQGAWEGVRKFATEKGKTYNYYQPTTGADATDDDRIVAIKRAVSKGAKVIVLPGYSQAQAINKMAQEYPEVKFIFVDGWSLGFKNVTAVIYREEESGYMAGYAAVMDGYTKLGGVFGGGGTNPACNRFGYGFVQGARAAAKEKQVKIEIRYTYKYAETFRASDELQDMMLDWYTSGTEVVFACGGSIFYSVKQAAELTKHGKVIGVDVDQSSLSSRVITSAVKGLDTSVYTILETLYEGEWDKKLAFKAVKVGADEDATGIPYATSKFKKFAKAKYEEILNNIKDGKVWINIEMPENCNSKAWLDLFYSTDPYLTIIFE